MVRAVFPGTFDPIHYGHIDIAKRAARLFDEVVVAVYDKPLKKLLFSPETRIALAKKTLNGLDNIRITGYSGLTVDFCHEIDAQVIVRGLRVFSDFEYEFRIALANHSLAPNIEVVALITNKDHTFLSGSTVREISSLGGDVSSMVPKIVEKALEKRFKELGENQNIVPQTSLLD
ncbi:MAG: pantetheine-phosphate adenylyltransferase [Anaerolineaceae bacterium 4572_5.1]|nr:MAG: pantetheine-phosphate adenylyltransferase [Anaerolineaceae bacterium 4572_5.1]